MFQYRNIMGLTESSKDLMTTRTKRINVGGQKEHLCLKSFQQRDLTDDFGLSVSVCPDLMDSTNEGKEEWEGISFPLADDCYLNRKGKH